MQDKSNPPQVPEMTSEYKIIVEQFKVTLKLARIGEHFLRFIVKCRKMNKNPLEVLKVFEQLQKEADKDVPDSQILIPVMCFAKWMEDASEENFQILQRSLAVKIDKMVQNEVKAEEETNKR